MSALAAESSDDDWENDASDDDVATIETNKPAERMTAEESLKKLIEVFNPRTRKDHRTAGLALGIKLRTNDSKPEDVGSLFKSVFSSLASQLSFEEITRLQQTFNQNAASVRATIKKRKEVEEAATPRQLSAAAKAMLQPKKKKKKKKKKTAKSYSAFDEDQEMNWDGTDEQGEGYLEATTYKSGRNFGKAEW